MPQEETLDNSRVVVFGLCIVLTLVLLVALLFVMRLRPLAVGHQVFAARLSDRAMGSEVKAGHFPSSGWRIYDRKGRQVGEINGAGDQQFRDSLNTILQSPELVGSDRTLAWEVDRLVDKNGRTLKDLPEADFTIVKYWVESCAPCQTRDQDAAKALQDVLDSYKNVTVDIVNVDADIQKRARELANAQQRN